MASAKPPADKHESGDQYQGPRIRAWRPDKPELFGDGPELRGELVDVSIGSSMYGDYPIFTFEDKHTEDTLAWHAMQQLAKTEAVEANLQIGDDVQVNYGGRVKQQRDTGRNPYAVWKVTNHTRPKNVQDILRRFGPAQPLAPRTTGQFEDEPDF